MIIKCADCGCDPEVCKRNECPECILDVCCCLQQNSSPSTFEYQ